MVRLWLIGGRLMRTRKGRETHAAQRSDANHACGDFRPAWRSPAAKQKRLRCAWIAQCALGAQKLT
jgi:hypothetical protein